VLLFALWYFPDIAVVDKPLKKEASPSFSVRVFKSVINYVKILFLIQLSITLLMMPIQLLSFSGFNLLAPLINFIAIPLFSLLVIPLILLGAFFALLGDHGSLISNALFAVSDKLISFFFNLFEQSGNYYQLLSNNQSAWAIFCITSLCFCVLMVTFSKNNGLSKPLILDWALQSLFAQTIKYSFMILAHATHRASQRRRLKFSLIFIQLA